MGRTYKKKLRAEKAKVKLKGAKLPKGLNVTKTEFKIRKITIRDQVKGKQCVEGQTLPNLKEIISRLKHYNEKYRLDALRNLRYAIKLEHPELVNKLNNIVQGIAALCLDVEREVRRDSFKTLTYLLEYKGGESDMAPFFPIISSYLRCAMTHIQPTIQEDSLRMLDVLLQYVPYLVTTQSNKIFENFLEMISKIRNEGDRADRLLTVNMGNNQTTVKWRSKVLQRLQKMFSSLVQYKRQKQYNEENRLLEQRCQMCIKFNTKIPQYYGAVLRQFPSSFEERTITSTLFNNSLNKDKVTATLCSNYSISPIKDSSHEIRNYIVHLMPLLKESWLEVKPQIQTQFASTSSRGTVKTLLSTETIECLSVVLDIMDNLWSLIDIEETLDRSTNLTAWFQNHSRDMFTVNFISDCYPYQIQKKQTEDKKTFKKSNRKVLSTGESDNPLLVIEDCTTQNVLIAYLLCRFNDNESHEKLTEMPLIINYLAEIIVDPIPPDTWKPLLKVLKVLLLTKSRQMLKYYAITMKNLIRNALKLYLECKSHQSHDSPNSISLLLILCDIVQDPELCTLYGINAEFNEFLNYLPQLLLKPNIQEQTLLVLTQLAKQQNPQFLKVLSLYMQSIMENLSTIQIAGCTNVFEGKKQIINLFYWCKIKGLLNPEEVKDMFDNIGTVINDVKVKNYCRYVFNLQ